MPVHQYSLDEVVQTLSDDIDKLVADFAEVCSKFDQYQKAKNNMIEVITVKKFLLDSVNRSWDELRKEVAKQKGE